MEDNMDSFFKRIDECGGWPVGAKWVTMTHSVEDKRPCYFTSKEIRDEWNTSIYSDKDYYLWKLKQAGIDFTKMAKQIENIGYTALDLSRELRALEVKEK